MSEDAEDSLPDSKYKGQPREQFVGKTVTLSFQSRKRGVLFEHCQVHVDGLDGEDELSGTLLEDPAFATQHKKGDIVTFWVEEIETVGSSF